MEVTPFLVDTAEHSAQCGRCAPQSPTVIMKWANSLRILKKKFAEAQGSPSHRHQLAH